MTHTYISDTKLNSLEEDFRKYHSINSIIATILVEDKLNREDVNDWIRGSREYTQKALTDMIKVEDNEKCQMWLLKKKAIRITYDSLTEDLKRICDVYMWGELSYLNWYQIGKIENYSKSTVYRIREKILKIYADILGESY